MRSSKCKRHNLQFNLLPSSMSLHSAKLLLLLVCVPLQKGLHASEADSLEIQPFTGKLIEKASLEKTHWNLRTPATHQESKMQPKTNRISTMSKKRLSSELGPTLKHHFHQKHRKIDHKPSKHHEASNKKKTTRKKHSNTRD